MDFSLAAACALDKITEWLSASAVHKAIALQFLKPNIFFTEIC